MSKQITDAIQEELKPCGVYVRTKVERLCMIECGNHEEYSPIEKLL